jgi:hypothetical protein
MKAIRIVETAGDFAEDKDLAASVRDEHLRPAVEAHHKITIDFTGVSLVTQSFVHALISDVLRKGGEGVLKLVVFRGCNDGVRGIVETVVQYSLEAAEE